MLELHGTDGRATNPRAAQDGGSLVVGPEAAHPVPLPLELAACMRVRRRHQRTHLTFRATQQLGIAGQRCISLPLAHHEELWDAVLSTPCSSPYPRPVLAHTFPTKALKKWKSLVLQEKRRNTKTVSW